MFPLGTDHHSSNNLFCQNGKKKKSQKILKRRVCLNFPSGREKKILVGTCLRKGPKKELIYLLGLISGLVNV